MAFIGIVLIFYLSDNKKLYIDLTEYNTEYFVVIYNNGNLKNSELNWNFPFNKKIKPNNNSIIIPEEYKEKYQIKVETPRKWYGFKYES